MTLANASVDESNIIYNINESTTHYLNMSIIKIGNNEPVRFSYFASDIFHINENINEKINFYFVTKRDSLKCQGIIGIGVNNVENYNNRDYNFIYQLKKKKIINKYAMTFSNINNKDYLILGDYPEEYNKEAYSSKIRIDIFTSNLNYFQYKYALLINNIISLNETIEVEKNIVFDLSSAFIEASYKYKDFIQANFFDKYMNTENPKCHIESSNFLEYFYYCDKDIDISDMPSLIFQINNKNLNITLNSYNLFELIEDKLFFIVIFKISSPINWKVGYLGLKKFNMTFNQDEKTISFYQNIAESENNNNVLAEDENKVLLISLICLAVIFIILLTGFIFYYFKKKKNKKIANELDDDFVYESKDKDKLGINQ